MKHLKNFDESNVIDKFLETYNIRNWILNGDGSIDVHGNVVLNRKYLKNIPIKFNYVSGHFYCQSNLLTSLKGCPKEVGGLFNCSGNNLISLEGCPEKVGGNFECQSNLLTSLKGCPKEVGYLFDCSSNNLKSLEFCPTEIDGDFYCLGNKLKNLLFAPKFAHDYLIDGNPLPIEIFKNNGFIIDIIRNQDEYNIWKLDGTLDQFRFGEMMIDIKNESNK